MLQNIEELLTKEEVEFVKVVFLNPNCKLSKGILHVDDGSEYGKCVALWENPEKLGIIKCTGSYKWEPVLLEMKLFAVRD